MATTGSSTQDLETLILRVSGDAQLGSPTFTLLLDGVAFGATYAATASHAAGEWQDIVVTGAFGSPKKIGLTFNNDYANGYDRNLYVDKITLNGKVFEGENASNPVGVNNATEAALFQNGTLTFDTTAAYATNSLVVRASAASASGPSQFIVFVDGTQIGGVYGTSASLARGEWENVTVAGNFSSDASSVVVKFVNDWSDGVDRSLYVDSVTLGQRVFQGETAQNAAGYNGPSYAELYSNGPLTFDTRPVTNSMTLRVSGMSATGSSQFTVTIDGQKVGGTYSTNAVYKSGEWQDITIAGAFAAIPKKVAINFINDYDGGVDRTLYVDKITLNGATFEGENAATTVGMYGDSSVALTANGTLTFDTYGEIDLRVSQDAPNGGAPKFKVTVDGKQIGDILTTSASHAANAWETIKVAGIFGDSPKNLSVTLLNDYDGGLDQNIFVDRVTLNGQNYEAERGVNHAGENSATAAALWSNGSLDLGLMGTITLDVSGRPTGSGVKPEFTVTVDGKQIGGVQTVTASRAAGEWQTITLTGSFGSDPGSVAINYEGENAVGRLYVAKVTVNGVAYDARADGTNYAGQNATDSAAVYKHDALTFDTDHSNQPLAAFEGSHAVAFKADAYVNVGNVLQYGNDHAWSAVGAVNVQAVPQFPQLIFGNASAPTYGGYELYVNEQGHLNVRIISNFGKGDYLDVSGTSLVADGTYHVVGASYDGSSKASGVKIYIDGVLETPIVNTDSLVGSSVSTGPMIIGNQVDGLQNQFYLRGALDSFALSDVERAASYFAHAATAASVDANTVLAYDFNQAPGTTVLDASGHHYDGTITGGVLWV